MPALIGGLALAAHAVVRGTRDVDFLVDVDDADRLHAALIALDYRCVHRSADAANYVREDEGLDLIYAHRPIARRLLRTALERDTPMGRLRVVSAEALIGFKLQALVNDPSRGRDLADIRALLRAQRGRLNMSEVREYLRCSSAWSCSMNCLPKSATAAPEGRAEGLVGRDVSSISMPAKSDLSDWIDLMDAIKALCPVWPEHQAGSPGIYKL